MNIKARDRESIKKVIVLSSITSSYVEGLLHQLMYADKM